MNNVNSDSDIDCNENTYFLNHNKEDIHRSHIRKIIKRKRKKNARELPNINNARNSNKFMSHLQIE